MKKLFQGIKSDIKFKTAGPGHRLNEERLMTAPTLLHDKGKHAHYAAVMQNLRALKKPMWRNMSTLSGRSLDQNTADIVCKEEPKLPKPPAGQAQIAAASAAIARIESVQGKGKARAKDTVRVQVAKQLETELEPNITPNQKNKPISEKKATSVCNVLFRCPLSGEILKKNEREAHIRKNIELLSSTDPVSASIMKIHTFNKDRDKVKSGVETIAKYLSNIVDNPNEEKYRSIKLSNKVFQEKIACLEGSHEFFEAIGFQKESHTLPGSDVQDEFYVLSSETVGNMDDLQSYRDSLLNGEPIRATLERLPRVFAPSPEASRFDLPDDFYNLTLEEIKREQQLRKEKLERESALRTKAMREREEQREIRKYNYTVIRIRFSDGYILQGIFYAQEKLSTLFDFVCQHLQNDWLPYELIAPCGQKLNDKEMTFFNCGLVPSALLTFHWDANVLADIEAAQGHKAGTALKQEFISTAETLD